MTYYIVSINDDLVSVYESDHIPAYECEAFQTWDEAWRYAEELRNE